MTGRPAHIELLQSHSLTMVVRRELERMVLAGELAVGEKLNEPALSARLGVSRGPIREAFSSLAEVGLVRVEKNRGVFVREISVAEADEIYEMRAMFDQLAGRKLAQAIQPAQLAALKALVGEMQAAARVQDLERYHAANLAFHDALVEYSGNVKLLQMYRRLVNELGLYRRHSLAEPRRLPKSTREHQKILELIAAGDGEAAGQKLYDHAMSSQARMHNLPAAGSVPPEVRLAGNQ